MEVYIVSAIIVAIIVYIIVMFNKLVALYNRAKNGFAQINVQLKRRYDLIPNLVNTAKGYLKHERETLDAVVAARNEASNLLAKLAGNLTDAEAAKALAGAEGTLGSAMGSFKVAVEAYPDLKASANMMQLTEELTSTENKVAFARQSYNDAVNEYNIYRQSFPQNLIAGAVGYGKDLAFLEFAEGEKLQEAPQVSF